jgi:hypothetical protein
MSNPVLKRVSGVPSSVKPEDSFTVSVTVDQKTGADPWGSEAQCTSPGLDPTGWRTPVRVLVEGDEITSEDLCIPNDVDRETELPVTVEGEDGTTHSVEIQVVKVTGSSYDFKGPETEVNDDWQDEVLINSEAEDRSNPSQGSQVIKWLERIADAVGGTVQQVAFGAIAAVLILVVM